MTENEVIDVEANEISEENNENVNGVLVIVEPDASGALNFKVQLVGNTEITSVPTVLKLAAKQVDEQLGI